MYQEFYELINHFIFRDMAQEVAHMDLVCTALSSIGCVFLVLIPFIIVYKVVCMLCGR